VSVLGVNTRDDVDTAKAFERTFGVTYPSLNGADGTAIAALQGLVAVRAVPTALIIDPDGYVAARSVGRIEPSTLRSLVDAAGKASGGSTLPTTGPTAGATTSAATAAGASGASA